MQKINLRDLYPDTYKTDVFVDVAEEVLAAIRGHQQDDAAYERRKFRHKAHYSLNREDGIENDALNRPLTPEEILEQKQLREECIFRPSESKETVGVSPPSREKQVQVHGRESTGVLFWKEMAKERFAKRSSACHLFRLESFSFAHGVIPIDEDLVGTVLNPVQHSIC